MSKVNRAHSTGFSIVEIQLVLSLVVLMIAFIIYLIDVRFLLTGVAGAATLAVLSVALRYICKLLPKPIELVRERIRFRVLDFLSCNPSSTLSEIKKHIGGYWRFGPLIENEMGCMLRDGAIVLETGRYSCGQPVQKPGKARIRNGQTK